MGKVYSFLKFFFKSTNQHGVHSPFIFNLITKCFYRKCDTKKSSILKSYKNKLLANKNTIQVTDFGAGSKIFKSDLRAINKIATHAGINSKRAHLLCNIANYFQPKTVLEIGTSLGIATTAIHLGNPNAKITTLEGCINTANVTKKQFKDFTFQNINVVIGEFSESLQNLTFKTDLDMVYFDGNHQKEATLKYFQHCLQFINNDSVFIFDDIHWSKEMEIAWQKIKNHPQVKVTIDTFQWGIVFFRKEQEKEHFIIRV